LFSKRAQVTLFIIVGLVLVIFTSLAVYISTSSNQVSETQTLERVPTSFTDYIELCIENTAQEAITTLGAQGGYIQVPTFIRIDDQAFISYDPRNQFGVPAWYYKGEYRIPSIGDMETQISRYVENRLDVCLSGFEAFSDYDVTEKTMPEATTKIADRSVFVDVSYDVDVVAKGSQVDSFDRFTVTLPVKLGLMHELAQRIVYSEVKNTNFENELINLMSANPDVPITGMSFSGRPETWTVEEVANEIKALIFYNFQGVRFKDTDFIPFEETEGTYERYRGFDLMDYREGRLPSQEAPSDAYDFFNLYFDPNDLPSDYPYEEEDFSMLRTAVKFYPNNDFRIIVRPSSGNLMTSNMATFPGTEIPFPLQVSHFTYDLDFLLELNVLDPDAFTNEQFVFKFALPVSLRKNEPDKETPAVTFYEAPVQFDNPCDSLTDDKVDVRAIGLFAGIDNMELDDVSVSYDCLKFGCYLGQTDSDGGSYRLYTGIPDSCSGGFINLEKEGYLPARKQLIDQDLLRIEMHKMKTFKLEVENTLSNRMGIPEPLDEEYSVIVRIDPYTYEDTIIQEITSDTTNATVDLLADEGNYFLDILLLDTEYEQVIGGYRGNLTYTYADTIGRDTLKLKVVEYSPRQIPFTAESQLAVMQYINDGLYRSSIKPEFS
jgi:hypothetical protein